MFSKKMAKWVTINSIVLLWAIFIMWIIKGALPEPLLYSIASFNALVIGGYYTKAGLENKTTIDNSGTVGNPKYKEMI